MTAGSVADARGRRLLLRADGSSRIGLGHLMRLLALGQAWADAGGLVEAFIGEAPDAIVGRYEREGMLVRRLRDEAGRDPLGRLAGAVADDPSSRAAIDHPGIDVDALARLGDASARTLVVDDMARLERYPVALVLNQNAHADRADYPPDGDARYLLGLRHVLLRREFRADVRERPMADRARRILVTFGGADPTGMTRRTIEALAGLPDHARTGVAVRVVVGAANPSGGDLEAVAARAGLSLRVERGLEAMVEPMSWADLAVTSGGSTVWELARTGCPAIVVETAPAESFLVRGLERVGLFDRLGPADRLDGPTLRAAIEVRMRDRAWRTSMARRGRELVDGDGARRVVAALATVDAR
jgi:spore coat polysaccharide biosynthesis predicted glycosyltransferase SpsG